MKTTFNSFIITILLIILLNGTCQKGKYTISYLKAYYTDIKAIRNWIKNYTEAINTADIERILSCESEDVYYLPPNQPHFSGKENLRKWFWAYFNYCTPSESLDLVDFQVFGDFAYLQGTYSVSGKTKLSGEEFTDKGKYVNFFKRQPYGDWLCTQSIWNSDYQIYGIHSQIPADFSGKWKLDLSKSTPPIDVTSATLKIIQKVNEITLSRIYEIQDREPIFDTFKYIIGSETTSTSKTGYLITKSFWSSDKQTFTIKETLISKKNFVKQEYRRITVYSLTAKGEVLNIISDDSLPKGLLSPTNKSHFEMIYNKL
jgi:ketosteroid isomerase-like protein